MTCESYSWGQTWGHRVLEALLESDHEVPLAITHAASDNGYETIWNDSVAGRAERHRIPVVECRYGGAAELGAHQR